MHHYLRTIAPLMAFGVAGCNDRLMSDLFGSSYGSYSSSIQGNQISVPQNQMRSSELSQQQLSQLFYLAPGQSRKAMTSWSQGKYPHWVDSQTEIYKLNDNPGTCLQLKYDSSARYQSKDFVPC